MAIERNFKRGQTYSSMLSHNYTRRYLNYTGRTLTVIDAFNAQVYLDPISEKREPQVESALYIEETYIGVEPKQIPGFLSSDHPMSNKVSFHTRVSVTAITKIPEMDILRKSYGLYEEKTNLLIVEGINSRGQIHPNAATLQTKIGHHPDGAWTSIEVYDSDHHYGNLYANINGNVQLVRPNRSAHYEECVVVKTKDIDSGNLSLSQFTIDELLNGEGRLGFRLYKTPQDAKEDNRNPDKVKIEKERCEWATYKDKMLRKVVEETTAALEAEFAVQKEQIVKSHKEEVQQLKADREDLKRQHAETLRRQQVKEDKLHAKYSEEVEKLKAENRKAVSELDRAVDEAIANYKEKLDTAEDKLVKSKNQIVKERSGLVGGIMKLASSVVDFVRWGLAIVV